MLPINGNVIERTTSTKFLGNLLNEHLSWKATFQLLKIKFQNILELYIKPKKFSVRVD